ncbi:glycoside hydrolase family 3 C-terminal domain-containing protein [Bifidobacterium xylocopae]|uniref:glycoside hydrolase family 3 C-terminal domain-containing protein n=1 Tax=Bifidobacterium xylocopae TaxID=2493119 RepID=UPI001F1724D1|nr:glycoside hydrolase family 3 C-terminal domain-containing protein [Bifidobacterium xylocopae]
MKALKGTGKTIVLFLVAGSPVATDWIGDCEALLYIGLAGQASAAATLELLTGEVNPSGHLAETWPMAYEDCPSPGGYPATERDAVAAEGAYAGHPAHLSAAARARPTRGCAL